MVARMPDLEEYDFDELDALISEAQKVRARKVEARRRELEGELEAKRQEIEAELAKLGGGKPPRLPAGLTDGRKRNSPRVQFRGPNGEEYSNRGPLPKWAKDLGITDKAGLEKYRVSE